MYQLQLMQAGAMALGAEWIRLTLLPRVGHGLASAVNVASPALGGSLNADDP
jgi:hypothetical protein